MPSRSIRKVSGAVNPQSSAALPSGSKAFTDVRVAGLRRRRAEVALVLVVEPDDGHRCAASGPAGPGARPLQFRAPARPHVERSRLALLMSAGENFAGRVIQRFQRERRRQFCRSAAKGHFARVAEQAEVKHCGERKRRWEGEALFIRVQGGRGLQASFPASTESAIIVSQPYRAPDAPFSTARGGPGGM